MTHPARTITHLAGGALVAGTLLLGVVWLADRAHRWEEPQWPGESFVPLRAGPAAEPSGRAVCVAPINLHCPRCVDALRRLHAAWPPRAAEGTLVALIVDTPVRPRAAALRAIPPLPVWWDPSGVWRRRWGHRLYGELIEFDDTGRFVRTRAVTP